jgi:hypothetical protein
MKQVLFIIMLLFILGVVFSYAQCDKTKVLTASKTEYLDANKVVQKTIDETTRIEYSKSEITIIHGSDGDQMTGTIKSDSCDWKTPFKEGRSVIKAIISERSGDTKNLTITLEGKDGKLTFLAEVDEMPDRKLRLVVDKFEEKK